MKSYDLPCYSVTSKCVLSPSNNNKGGVLVHFWMVFVVPRLKSPAVCEECVGAILRDSVHTSMKNRSSVGYLLGLPVDIDSILINGVSQSLEHHIFSRAEADCCVSVQLFSDRIILQVQVGDNFNSANLYLYSVSLSFCHLFQALSVLTSYMPTFLGRGFL